MIGVTRGRVELSYTPADGERRPKIYQGRLRCAAWDSHVEAGGTEDDWEEPLEFDLEAAAQEGAALAARATSRDSDVQAAACEEIAALGMDAVEVMSAAYSRFEADIREHDRKVQELERRRRDVQRDFDALRKLRSDKDEVIEG